MPDINNPNIFLDCPYGSGSFGKWIIDEYGLPAYEYTLNQEKEEIALWWNTAKKDNRTHWHQIGNFRFTAVADNNGVVQLITEENGFKWLNLYDEQRKNYSGNFAFIDDSKSIWSTAYRFRPKEAKVKRIFGMGYFKTEIEYHSLNIRRITFAPYGDDPIIISEILIENISNELKEIDYYEYWDVNIHQLITKLISSGTLDPSIPQRNEEDRNSFNRYFIQRARIDNLRNAGIIDTELKYPEAKELKVPPSGYAKEFDDSPPSIFLVPLDGGSGEGFIFEQSIFFNDETNIPSPDIRNAKAYRINDEIPENLREVPALNQPLMITHKRKVKIKPKELIKFRYGYGYTKPFDTLDFLEKYSDSNQRDDPIRNTIERWKEKLAYFVPHDAESKNNAFLHREIAWHSYYLQSASYWREYTKTHVVSQGGEYLFGHGFDGATRDYCIFSVVLTYLNPGLAKEILRFIMLTTSPDGQMTYANYGDTSLSVVITLSKPSDLDIFFLWAMSEYLMATGDYDFLKERLPFYSDQNIFAKPTSTVLDHIRVAFDHLRNVIGVGEHGLIRIGTGDWSDGILWFTEDPDTAEKKGESTFNTAFATYVLPKIAEAIEDFDGDLAQSMRKQAENYRIAMKGQWGGRWYFRGWQGNGKPFGNDRIFLEPQVWALIAGIPEQDKVEILLNSIYKILDSNSPIGARIVYPPKEDMIGGLSPGTDINGGIWHATNSLLTWAYSLYNPIYAWESFKKNTLAVHAETYPNIWYGIWTGPDSYNSPESDRPGEAAAHHATALTDHPVFNMNQHANPLLALIKLAGINSRREGYEIFPHLPFNRWIINLPNIGIKYDDESRMVSGYTHSLSDRNVKLWVKIPSSIVKNNVKITITNKKDGITNQIENFNLDSLNNIIIFQFDVPKNARIEWSIKY